MHYVIFVWNNTDPDLVGPFDSEDKAEAYERQACDLMSERHYGKLSYSGVLLVTDPKTFDDVTKSIARMDAADDTLTE